jgi:NTP pyrophosphatase (non-canonical NTP hydrolase)
MVEFIRDQLPEEELLAQLAEEATELAQAALKMRRILDGRNPTPVRLSEAWANLQEEIADVLNCLQVLDISTNDQEYQETIRQKQERWCGRLWKRDNEEGEF